MLCHAFALIGREGRAASVQVVSLDSCAHTLPVGGQPPSWGVGVKRSTSAHCFSKLASSSVRRSATVCPHPSQRAWRSGHISHLGVEGEEGEGRGRGQLGCVGTGREGEGREGRMWRERACLSLSSPPLPARSGGHRKRTACSESNERCWRGHCSPDPRGQ